jgi:excisionase family DNA binding protein
MENVMKTLTVNDVANRYGVSVHTVLTWLKAGELKAVNAARRTGTRPQWRISEEAIAQFEAARSSRAEPPQKKRRKRSGDSDVIEIIK